VRPGTQERNFTHVLDLVDGLVAVGERGEGDEYGLGNEKAYSIREVAELFGFGDNVVMFPTRPGNRMTADLDTTKTRKLGWSAGRSLEEYIRSFVEEHPRGKQRDKRVLVFSTTFAPVSGLAEDAFTELARAVPEVEFAIVTTRFSRDAAHTPPPAPNITLHRIGFGAPFDKFLLPLLGPFVGFILWSKHRYLFAWGLMASYAALAGFFFKTVVGAPFLITLADQNIDDLTLLRRALFSILLSRADQVYGTHGAQEATAMRVAGKTLPRNSLGEGDAFANALRFAYADIVRKAQEQS